MPAANWFQEQIELLGADTARVVMQVYDNMRSAGIPRHEIVATLGMVTFTAALQGQQLGRDELARNLVAKGIDPADAVTTAAVTIGATGTPAAAGRLDAKTKIVESLLAEEQPEQQLNMRLERLAKNDAMESVQIGYTHGMRESTNVAGYRRVLEASACELCVWLYRGGFVYAPQRPLTTHKGCVCSAEPLTPDEVRAEADMRYTTINRYGQRVPNPAGGGQSISAHRYADTQRDLWHMRADLAERGHPAFDEWTQIAEDGKR